MTARFLHTGMILAGLALAGCNANLEDIAPASSGRLSPALVQEMKAKGMSVGSPIMVRIFKEESVLEVWKQKDNGRYDLVKSYNICKWSGKLGPKFKEGDRQAPEGFYAVGPAAMNPKSQYHLSFNTGFPNTYDRVHGRTGAHLMVHGACSSSGCYSMTDPQMQEIYAFARDAFGGGQAAFQLQAYPFRMTAANMARYKDDTNYGFWKNLKEGYDHFEITKVPPKVDVCEKRYVFNSFPEGEARFTAAGACPPSTLPASLQMAYQSYQSTYTNAFSAASQAGQPAPKPSIVGPKEADLVADWSKKRARGERVTMEPPSMQSDGSVVATTASMGRIDSPAGRRMAAIDAEKEAKRKAEEEKKAALARAKAEEEAKKLAAAKAAEEQAAAEKAAKEVAAKPAEEKPAGEAVATGEESMVSGMRKRIVNLFGG